MVGILDGEKNLKICLFVFNLDMIHDVTDGQIHTHRHRMTSLAVLMLSNHAAKTECLCREGYISPLCTAYPCEPNEAIVTPLRMWGLMGDVITHAPFQLNCFRGYGATVPLISIFLTHSNIDPYKQL